MPSSRWNRKYLLLLVPFGLGLVGLRYFASFRPAEIQSNNGFGNLGGRPMAIAWSPDGKLVCATDNGYVQILMPDTRHWRSFKTPQGGFMHGAPHVLRLRFSGDGETLYSGGVVLNTSVVSNSDGVISVWNVKTGQLNFSLSSINGPAFDVNPDRGRAAVGDGLYVKSSSPNSSPGTFRRQGTTWLLDLKAPPLPTPKAYASSMSSPPAPNWREYPSKACKTNTGNIACVALSPDSKFLAIGTDAPQKALSVWNAKTAKPLSIPGLPTFTPNFLEWSPDSTRLACASSSQIAVFNVQTGTSVQVALPTSTVISASKFGSPIPSTLAWSPDGQTLFSGGDQVRMWHASDLKLGRTFAVSGPVAISPDGKTLATANNPTHGKPNGILLWAL